MPKRLAFLCVVPLVLSTSAFAQSEQPECVLASPGPGFEVDGGKIVITREAFEISDDVESVIKRTFGSDTALADWQILKSLLSTKAQLSEFIKRVGIPQQKVNGPCDNFLVSNSGQLRLPNGFWMFIARHDGRVPENWAVLDSLGDHALDLGRWSHKSQALVVVHSFPAAEKSPNVAQTRNTRQKQRPLISTETLEAKIMELYKAGQYSDAIPLAQRLLAIQEKALGPDHPYVADSLNTLASLYEGQARYADAEPLCKRSLTIREKTFGANSLEVGQSLNTLANLYEEQGRYADAEQLYKRSLAIREKALGPDHPYVAGLLKNLGALRQKQGGYADAEQLYKRSLTVREKTLGPDSLEVGESLNALASLYKEQGRYVDAEAFSKRSLAIREKALGPDHPDVAASLNSLAAMYHVQGRYADAEPLYKRSLAIEEKAVGPGSPYLAASLNNLAVLYKEQGRYVDAEAFSKRSLAIREKDNVHCPP
jgi:tetratricopeptide (TPR) repeat protein